MLNISRYVVLPSVPLFVIGEATCFSHLRDVQRSLWARSRNCAARGSIVNTCLLVLKVHALMASSELTRVRPSSNPSSFWVERSTSSAVVTALSRELWLNWRSWRRSQRDIRISSVGSVRKVTLVSSPSTVFALDYLLGFVLAKFPSQFI